MKIKKGDKVIVVSGKDKGKTGTVAKAFPKELKILIEGINMAKRHMRPNAKNRMGQIIEKSIPVHVSNVMIADPKGGKPTRVGIKKDAKGSSRIAKKSGSVL
jgi:large subunit ribosomal protein L24